MIYWISWLASHVFKSSRKYGLTLTASVFQSVKQKNTFKWTTNCILVITFGHFQFFKHCFKWYLDSVHSLTFHMRITILLLHFKHNLCFIHNKLWIMKSTHCNWLSFVTCECADMYMVMHVWVIYILTISRIHRKILWSPYSCAILDTVHF